MTKGNREDQKVSAILTKSIEPFSMEAESLVQADLCDKCPKGDENCYPCGAAQIYFDKIISMLVSMSAMWN